MGYHVTYVSQPPNSPDLNMCDLTIFNSLCHDADRIKGGNHGNIMGLKESVMQAFAEYDSKKISIGFGYLYACMNCILKLEGDNRYKSPLADVRKKFAKKLPLNTVDISYNEFCRLKTLV